LTFDAGQSAVSIHLTFSAHPKLALERSTIARSF
jgi:hypothetical protein